MVSRRGISGKRWLDLNEDRYLFKNGQPKFNKYNQIIVAWCGPSMDVDTMRRSFLFIYLWMQRILLKKNKTAAKTQSKPSPSTKITSTKCGEKLDQNKPKTELLKDHLTNTWAALFASWFTQLKEIETKWLTGCCASVAKFINLLGVLSFGTSRLWFTVCSRDATHI